jgi:hypothetical protein
VNRRDAIALAKEQLLEHGGIWGVWCDRTGGRHYVRYAPQRDTEAAARGWELVARIKERAEPKQWRAICL